MDDISSRNALRDRILNDLRSTVKQIYHESVNNELRADNKTYLCLTLIKNVDEALRHGLKQLHLGYWRPLQKILHPQTLQLVEQLPKYDGSELTNLTKGRTWIALSLKDESFISYVQCLAKELSLDKFYEHWSILRNNDACNRFLSILLGLDNVVFNFHVEYLNKPPSSCNFSAKLLEDIKPTDLNLSKMASTSSLTSPVDSGVHIQDSSSDTDQPVDEKQIDIDYLNGNVPESVVLRKRNKDTKRHVSFHEDIIYKSPDKCRKLKWDSENLRYSWSGEDLDPNFVYATDFGPKIATSSPLKDPSVLNISERGVPEGEETPSNAESFKQMRSQKSIIVKRFLQSIKKQSKIKQLSKKYSESNSSYRLIRAKVDEALVKEVNDAIESEYRAHQNSIPSKHEIQLKPRVIRKLTRHYDRVYKTYQLRDYLFIIATSNIYLLSKNLEVQIISLDDVKKIMVFPNSHKFLLWESNERFYTFISGDTDLTNELIGRLEMSMRRNHSDLPSVIMLQHEDLSVLKKTLVEKMVISKSDVITYYGAIQFERECEFFESVTPSSKRGFLMYRDNRSRDGWVPGDFSLKGGILYLFSEGAKLPKLAINLATTCRSCSRTQNSDRPYTFQITLVDKEVEFQSGSNCFYEDRLLKSKLTLSDTSRMLSKFKNRMNQLLTLGTAAEIGCLVEFAAADEYDMSDWLQMIIQSSCGECCEDASKDNVIDATLLLTKDSLILLTETFSPQYEVEVLSCAQLSEIASFKIGDSSKDLFTVMEFACMEASSTSGDWIIYLTSRDEVEKLKTALQRLWVFKNQFPLCYGTADRLTRKCRKTQRRLAADWTHTCL